MPANTPNGLPYPVGTDRVADGDDAIHALALAVDTATLAPHGGNLTLTGVSAGNITWSVRGGMGFLNISATTFTAALAAGSTLVVVSAANGIPAAYRPAAAVYAGIFSGVVVGFARLNPDGSIELRAQTASMLGAFGGLAWPAPVYTS